MSIMYKIYLRRLIPLLWCLGLGMLLISLFVPSPAAYAQALKKGHLQITAPLVNGAPQGRPGATVTVQGNGFESNDNVTLYYTTNGDSGQCTNDGDPGDHGLQQFPNNANFNAQNDGSFTQTVTWPDNANSPNTQYYICALSDEHNVHALSENSFTIVQSNATFDFTPKAAAPGATITVTGSQWTPPQLLTVSIANGDNTNPIVTQTVTSGADGNFSVQLTIPTNAAAGSYNVLVVATGDATLKSEKDNALTITQATPTPAPTPTQAPTTTVGPTPTATPSATGPDGTNSGGVTMLIYTMGGIGVMLVIVGVVMFAAYSRS